VLKCDVRSFYDSIDHAILVSKLGDVVRCERVMGLINRIVAGYKSEKVPTFLPGDDWLDAAQRTRGLPIGNLTSQLWGNFYLDALDHRVTEGERHGSYLRYTDDFPIFSDEKSRLWALREVASVELASVRLRFAEPKTRVLATKEGVPFCGFRFLPGLRQRILGITKRRFERRRYQLKKAGDIKRLGVSVFSWYQFSREGNTEGLRRSYARWPLDARLKRRRGKTSRGSRCVVEQQQPREPVVLESQQQQPRQP